MKEKHLIFDYASPECETVSGVISQSLCEVSLESGASFEDFTEGDEFTF